MHAVSGEISLAGSSADRVQAKTISGAVTCDLDNPYVRDLNIDTVSGSITIRVPEDADLRVSLGAASGGVSSAFPQVPTVRSLGTHSATGRLGAGTGQLRAYAVSGSVSLLASPAGGDPDADDETRATRPAHQGPDEARATRPAHQGPDETRATRPAHQGPDEARVTRPAHHGPDPA